MLLSKTFPIFALVSALVVSYLSCVAYADELGRTSDSKCSYGPYTDSTCSVVCGTGQLTKTRRCVCPNRYSGRPDCKGPPVESITVSCNAGPCCSWGTPHTNWTNCTNGYQTRNQTCVCKPGAPVGSTCSGPAPLETQPCCSWGNWSSFSDCNVNCGGGIQSRYRSCICGTPDLKPIPKPTDKKNCKRSGGDDDDGKNGDDDDKRSPSPSPSPPPSPTFIPNYCNGSAIETRPCNNISCCTWGNFSEWSNCTNSTCGGVRARYATCNCTYPYNISTILSCPPQLNQTLNSTASRLNLFCSGPQPNETQLCPNCTNPPITNCTWNLWSPWTQCNQSCNGTQYRRQLCACPGYNSTCPVIYSDSHCVGIPRTETRSCNNSCCEWTFIDNWSTCYLDNNCCGNGTQWRKPVCRCGDIISPDSSCLYAGVPPINQTRTCTSVPCCQLGPLNLISCSQIGINDPNGFPDFCVTPWSESACYCPLSNGTLVSAAYNQCLLNNFTAPPISYNFSRDTCGDPSTYPLPLITCTEYSNNSTCVAWTIEFNPTTQTIVNIYDPVTTASAECSYNTENCWDGWSEWSICCGSCNNATQWRRQITSTGYSTCRVPPAYETRPCNLTAPCCVWNYDNSAQWSNCSAICGNGTQHRFPYNCSCGNSSLCPTPPSLEVRNCTRTCCTFVGADESTLCDPNNCSLSYSWNSQKCYCHTNANTSNGFFGLAPACSISTCHGVPSHNTSVCPNCTIPTPTNVTQPVCEWRIISISNCTGNCSRIVVLNSPAPTTTKSPNRKSKQDDDDDDRKYKRNSKSGDDDDQNSGDNDDQKPPSPPAPSTPTTIQNATIISTNGTQIITRACFCGNQQVAPENCSSNFTVFTTQTCPLNCTCAWQNLTSWSACTCGKRYYTRKCNCSEIICGNTTTSPAPSHSPSPTPTPSKGDDDDDKRYKRSNNKKNNNDDDDQPKPPTVICTFPQATYSYTCGGYDIVFEDCSTVPPTSSPTPSSPTPTSIRYRELVEETATHVQTTYENHTSATSNLSLLVISTITIVILITAALVMILFKNHTNKS